LRIQAFTQKPGTDGSSSSHFLFSSWVTISGKVPNTPVVTFEEASATVTEDDASGTYSVNIAAAPTLATASSVNIVVDPASTASSNEYDVPSTRTLAAEDEHASQLAFDFNDDTMKRTCGANVLT
jgi:hypothetical protein